MEKKNYTLNSQMTRESVYKQVFTNVKTNHSMNEFY
jgi:hypothetical protein